MCTIKNDFISLLKSLASYSNSQYSGTGLILYETDIFPSKLHCDLQPHINFSEKLILGDSRLVDYLKAIGDYKHPLHDGFHLINEKGMLTHVSQFFSPPLSVNVQRIKGQGARTFTAACGSLVQGVMLIGIIAAKSKPYFFNGGRLIKIDRMVS